MQENSIYRKNPNHFVIDSSMDTGSRESHYVGISDGINNYSIKIPVKLKKKLFPIISEQRIPNYRGQIHTVAVALLIKQMFSEIKTVVICNDIPRKNLMFFLRQYLSEEEYSKIKKGNIHKKNHAHKYLKKVRRTKAKLSLMEKHVCKFIKILPKKQYRKLRKNKQGLTPLKVLTQICTLLTAGLH